MANPASSRQYSPGSPACTPKLGVYGVLPDGDLRDRPVATHSSGAVRRRRLSVTVGLGCVCKDRFEGGHDTFLAPAGLRHAWPGVSTPGPGAPSYGLLRRCSHSSFVIAYSTASLSKSAGSMPTTSSSSSGAIRNVRTS